MSEFTVIHPDVSPAAAPTQDELQAWERLSRDEQLRRLRASFADPACSRVSRNTMDNILTRARRRAGVDHG